MRSLAAAALAVALGDWATGTVYVIRSGSV
jgi:hypothetical protein